MIEFQRCQSKAWCLAQDLNGQHLDGHAFDVSARGGVKHCPRRGMGANRCNRHPVQGAE